MTERYKRERKMIFILLLILEYKTIILLVIFLLVSFSFHLSITSHLFNVSKVQCLVHSVLVKSDEDFQENPDFHIGFLTYGGQIENS